ncbi:hypothetical protein BDV28DRAFT_108056 [Aspergillus coremiiformis]|uniref:Oxidoreductase n=1 Tax=Aspergillus coremiiformis TaxID=138285 RepID=A0A5N6Z8C6_9EURO|nr:hypothetical protein BDV28DRAFT_108056 [Aspergillus coremiiformis]
MTSETNFLRSVLITGCSAGGIGSALAETFHSRGLHVFATARSASKMAHLEKLPNITLMELDVTDAKSIEAAVEVVTAKAGGKLDYLVNNSGQSIVMPALDTNIQDAKKLFDVNLWGVVAVTQAFSPLILAAKGTIVNISSIGAFVHTPWLAFYSASKAALDAYTHTIRLELSPFGVRVVLVTAGTVKTNIFKHYEECPLPPGSIYKPASNEIQALGKGELVQGTMPSDEFARKVVDDVLGGATGTIRRGKHATVVWTLLSIFPTWLIDRLMFVSSGLGKLV